MVEELALPIKGAVVGVVEDDTAHAALLDAILARAGFRPLIFHSARDFRRRNGIHSVDLILLDWNMPRESGLAFLKSLRKNEGDDIPVIFVTSNDQEGQTVEALAAGADDYVIKPVKTGELVARIQCVLRRSRAITDKSETFAPFEFHPARRTLRIGGQRVNATPKEFDLMLFLFRRAGRIVSREAILAHVWHTRTSVPTRTIDTYISRLRLKFGLDGQDGWKIEGVYQQGYRLHRMGGGP